MGKCWYILWRFGIFYRHLGYFMTIWYILWSFGTFCPVLVSCTKKNLATLVYSVLRFHTEKNSRGSSQGTFSKADKSFENCRWRPTIHSVFCICCTFVVHQPWWVTRKNLQKGRHELNFDKNSEFKYFPGERSQFITIWACLKGWTWPPRVNFYPYGQCSPLRSPPWVNLLISLEEWKGEQSILIIMNLTQWQLTINQSTIGIGFQPMYNP
jgi:hypothetical protein